jgi:tryptophanyl-tRNA synthetase
MNKPRLLTGDTSTGRLHLGHWIGSIENRVAMQDIYDCYFIIANVQALTTRAERPAEVKENVIEVAMDYLACGIDPKKSTIFIQSEIPAIAELTIFFSMIVPYPRLMRNPTLKDEIRDKGLGDNYPFGFLMYPISNLADILAFRAEIVPVGEDQLPHLELAREVARKFNQLYCGVDPHTLDADYIQKGGLFPIMQPVLGRTKRLIGIGAPNEQGQLLKMSKSLNNAIFLSDDADAVKTKVMNMYTDPKRLRATDPGTIENNPLWIFHDTFNPDKNWIIEAKDKYQKGAIGDVECKKKLIEALTTLLEPIRKRRSYYEKNRDEVMTILHQGTLKANKVTEETLLLAKKAMHQDYFTNTRNLLV